MPFTVECGTETYRIIGPNNEEGERVPWGTIATIKIGNEIYFCDGEEDADSQRVERIASSYPEVCVCEDVAFEDEPEDDDGVLVPAIGEEEEEDDEEDDEEDALGPKLV